jgi:hypothetical protein
MEFPSPGFDDNTPGKLKNGCRAGYTLKVKEKEAGLGHNR